MTRKPTPEPDGDTQDHSRPALEHIEQALRGLRFGEVKVIIQDGVVVQIERVERKRLV